MLLNGVSLGWAAIRAPLLPAPLRHHAPAMQAVEGAVEAQRGLVIGAARAAFLLADADGSGSLDRDEVLNLMERMMGEREDGGQASGASSIPVDEVERMFTKYSREAGELSYENFVLLLTECEADSALFTGLLSFAEVAVSAGVKGAFDPVSDAQRELVVKAARAAFLFADTDGSGSLDREEVLRLLERMMGEAPPASDESEGGGPLRASMTPLDEMERMFTKYSDGADELDFEQFVSLLSECESDSALFTGLLSFAEGAVSAGVKNAFNDVATSGSIRQTHILDDGSAIWRESIEAAFELCDGDRTGEISKEQLEAAVGTYPLIGQLLRCPVDLSLKQQKQYMIALFDQIDADGGNSIDRDEWISFFCPDRDAVPRAVVWDPECAECQKVTGFIFDCDGTIYQPCGMIPGAEDTLTWLERSGVPYVLLSNTGAKPYTAVYDKLTAPGSRFECRPDGRAIPPGRIYTAADAQVDFMLSGHLPAGSKLLVLAPDERWKDMMRARNRTLFESWEVVESMDVETAKEWASRDEHVTVVFFLDGAVASDWSYDLIHAITILIRFGADFIYTAEDADNPSIDARYPGMTFPMPGPGMFVDMLKKSMPPGSSSRLYCCGKGGNVGRKYMIDRAIQFLTDQGHSGKREHIMIVGDRFDTDVRAGVLAGIKSCLLETGAHTLEMADDFPTDLPSYSCSSIAELIPTADRRLALHVRRLLTTPYRLSARTAGQSTSDAAAVEERVREILEDRHWG